ncbi:MAG: peptide chain release factor N(5)-glutamine methyltransferase [Streptococcaceae bacterium]|nr:peptide chain release factor N(5)-glutamine methyltransferase [Streptococcaceae bacterium]MCH4177766.1 peptide chain release factor N(5)-glutamine methyltransferase [Streptococcaceae bacterium]
MKYYELLNEGYEVESLILHYKGWQKTDLLLNLQSEVDEDSLRFLTSAKAQLANDYPLQYLTQSVNFFDLSLYVDENVLIPRPETEELVTLILKDFDGKKRRVLDIGSGSGAISLALKANRPNWQILASDISENALKVTRKNAEKLDLEIETIQSDLFAEIEGQFDVIISNPPYIATNERELMDASVLKYEPDLALFAANNGLAIYQAIINEIVDYLNTNASVYFEIGFAQAEAVQGLLKQAFPKSEVMVFKDLFGNDRMVRMRLDD